MTSYKIVAERATYMEGTGDRVGWVLSEAVARAKSSGYPVALRLNGVFVLVTQEDTEDTAFTKWVRNK